MQPEPQWDREADVVVVGGGGAGLAAALEAAARGARVVLLEKCRRLGGTTGISVGSFTAACTAPQRLAGIADHPDWHVEDMGRFAPHLERRNNAGLRALLAGEAPRTLAWLADLGVQFHGPLPEPPNRAPRMHNVVPNAKAYIAVLQREALTRGVALLMEHRVTALLREQERIAGVRAEPSGRRPVCVKARKGVVLAAGDYSNGTAIKREFLPPDVAAIEGVNPHATGDGHLLAREVGAGLVNMDVIYGPEIRFVPPPRAPFVQVLPANPWLARIMGTVLNHLPAAVFHRIARQLLVTWQHPQAELFGSGAVLVNRTGSRFTDETARPELDIPRQPGGTARIVFDAVVAETYSKWPHFISTAPGIAYAYVQDYERLRPDLFLRGDTLSGLAMAMGVNPSVLEASIHRYNQAVRGEVDDPFGRQVHHTPLEKPPFYALGPVKSWIVTTEGGVRIDDHMRAMDASGRVIPGLFAAGCTGLGGMVMWGHGLHIAWAFTSGRLAGRYAAECLPRKLQSQPERDAVAARFKNSP